MIQVTGKPTTCRSYAKMHSIASECGWATDSCFDIFSFMNPRERYLQWIYD